VYANNVLTVLNIILAEAVKRKIIKSNPAAGIQKLKVERREKKLVTPAEIRRLFPPDWEGVWESELVCKANKLAAYTGMRIGEVLGLRGKMYLTDISRWPGSTMNGLGTGRPKRRKNGISRLRGLSVMICSR
jgi:integrase